MQRLLRLARIISVGIRFGLDEFVLAHRMVDQGRRFAAWNREAADRLAQNLAEYWIEERPLLARPADVRQFLTDVDQLRDDLARLEKRIEALTRKT